MCGLFKLSFRLYHALLTRWWNLSGRIWLKLHGVDYRSPPTLYGYPIIKISPSSKIVLGETVVLCSDSRFTDLGVSKPVILRTLQANASISIGTDTGLSGTSICAANSVEIGSQCLIGADVQIFDTDFHTMTAYNRRHDNNPEHIRCAPVVIEDNVFIGTGSKILKGVRIGRNSVIGAGSVVSKDIPPNTIAAGNPAKAIAELPV